MIDVVREIHQSCPWRDTGSCNICSGLDLESEEEVDSNSSLEASVSRAVPVIRLKRPQWNVFACDERFRVLVAGRRFGKTFLALVELCHAARTSGSLAWYVAPSYKQAKRIAWKPLKQLTRPYWDRSRMRPICGSS